MAAANLQQENLETEIKYFTKLQSRRNINVAMIKRSCMVQI